MLRELGVDESMVELTVCSLVKYFCPLLVAVPEESTLLVIAWGRLVVAEGCRLALRGFQTGGARCRAVSLARRVSRRSGCCSAAFGVWPWVLAIGW